MDCAEILAVCARLTGAQMVEMSDAVLDADERFARNPKPHRLVAMRAAQELSIIVQAWPMLCTLRKLKASQP